MYDKHWSDEELVARLYGVGPENDHLDVCDSCARRWEAVQGRYESLRAARIEVSGEFLAAQRRAIRARLGVKRRPFSRVLVPVLATLLLATIMIVFRHSPQPQPPVDKITDSQLFDDVFKRVSDPAPSAIGPIRSLFEEQK
jgi:hypothetical protein